ncbi:MULTISPECIES: polyprenyl synthetase family protein [unclassified Streptomyces]|uniref:polyprenyl synthetase family protein n=1 Tax=unclassified Streptomyces TaxID=2593676 RepID=UPI002E37C02D|nr:MULTISPECIES: polyprenyl synthetase family protein [unclassified Streptomyces]WUC68149.1 polyprenyl synthetase family protein [Streptomyces sp. NBC_00539]
MIAKAVLAHAPTPARAGSTGERVDADVPAAVRGELEAVLDGLLARARSLDPVFASDVAERLAAFTLRGGRRTRSRFLWWTARACGAGEDLTPALLRVATALELIQTCALVHDDVMDRSALRRGGPSFHTQVAARYADSCGAPSAFGASAAVLAGDLALAWADDLVAAADLPRGTRDSVLDIWRLMRTEMVAGQYLDLYTQATGTRSAPLALRTACLKTARYTVERPMALGAAMAGADAATAAALGAAGRCAGVAFQLRDDLLGVFGDPEVTGKPAGDDIRAGKNTYVAALAVSLAAAGPDARATHLLDRFLGDRSLTEEGLAEVGEVLRTTGAVARVERRIRRLAAAAERHLSRAELRGPGQVALVRLLREVASPHPAPEEGSRLPASAPAAAVRRAGGDR